MHVGNVVRVVGLWIELSRCVVSASVLVLGEDVFHAVMVEEVGGVVVVVEVFVAPEMAFQKFVGFYAVFGVSIAIQGGSGVAQLFSGGKISSSSSRHMPCCFFLMPNRENQLRNVRTDTATADGVFARVISILWIAFWYEVRHGGFAVAECGA